VSLNRIRSRRET